jgi:hypothetical protein
MGHWSWTLTGPPELEVLRVVEALALVVRPLLLLLLLPPPDLHA